MYQAVVFLKGEGPVLRAPAFQGNLLAPLIKSHRFSRRAEEEDVLCVKKWLSPSSANSFALRFTLAPAIPQESAATSQTGFGGHSKPLCALASKAPLITNSAIENRLEHWNKTDLKAVGQRILTEGNIIRKSDSRDKVHSLSLRGPNQRSSLATAVTL